MRVFILAAGVSEKWETYFRYPKELALITNEPLLVCTMRQLRKKCVDAIVITHKLEVLRLFPDDCARSGRYPHSNLSNIETVLDTQEMWEGRTVILLGDVLFSNESLDVILNEKADVAVYGRLNPQNLFAFTFTDHDRVAKAAEEVLKAAPVRCGTWELYRVLAGFSPHERHKFDKIVWKNIDRGDYTRDFDCLDNYAQFLREHPWARSA